MNFAELQARSKAHRDAIADRVAGGPTTENTDPTGEAPGEVDTGEAKQALGNLTEAERETLIAKAEEGDPVALDIVERALEDVETRRAATGNAGTGTRGRTGGTDPWAAAEARIRNAMAEGRRRQTGY